MYLLQSASFTYGDTAVTASHQYLVEILYVVDDLANRFWCCLNQVLPP